MQEVTDQPKVPPKWPWGWTQDLHLHCVPVEASPLPHATLSL